MDFLGENGLARLWEHVTSKLSTKVNKVNGMGLSSNDYTDEEKNKLFNIEEGAQVNTVISVNGKTGEITLTASDLGVNAGDSGELSDLAKEYVDNAVSTKADIVHTHEILDVNGLQEQLDAKISTDRTINGKYLSSDIVLNASDVGADEIGAAAKSLNSAKSYVEEVASGKANISHFHEISDVNNLQNSLDAKVSTTRTINGKPLSDDIVLTASDIGLESGSGSAEILDLAKAYTDEVGETKADLEHEHTTSDIIDLQTSLDTRVPTNRTINNKILTEDIVLSYSDVGADEIGSAESALNNAKSYTDDLMTTKSDVGHTHNDIYYTESEIDTKVLEINSSITDIIDGTTMVGEANHSLSSDSATNAYNAEKATMDSNGNVFGIVYETKSDATSKLSEAKSYADGIKNDLLNGAGAAYDTLKELGDLIDDNTDAISALETVAAGKANATHNHSATDITSGTLSSSRLPTVPITKGGTGATTASGVLTNLGITATVSELNYVDGVTSKIQTQLNNKASKNIATTSANGLMSYTDKIKLDGFDGENVYVQNDEPTDVPDGTLWVDLDAEGAEGGSGYTPVKGVDYWTDEDKDEIVQYVLSALPTWTGGSY